MQATLGDSIFYGYIYKGVMEFKHVRESHSWKSYSIYFMDTKGILLIK